MYIERLTKNYSGTQITDELIPSEIVTALAFTLSHDTLFAPDSIRTATSGGGTLLVLGTDYTLGGIDSGLTTKCGVNVYTNVQIINATYQGVDLYFTYKTPGDYASVMDANSQMLLSGKKQGLKLAYVSSDTLILSKGYIHVNDGVTDYWVQKTVDTSITSATSNFPDVGEGKFVCIDKTGAITLQDATTPQGATRRPADACFTMANELSTGKGGFYFSELLRIVGYIYKTSSTVFGIISCLDGNEDDFETSEIQITSADVTLTVDDLKSNNIVLSGTVTASRVLTLPVTLKKLSIVNKVSSATDSFTVTVSVGSNTLVLPVHYTVHTLKQYGSCDILVGADGSLTLLNEVPLIQAAAHTLVSTATAGAIRYEKYVAARKLTICASLTTVSLGANTTTICYAMFNVANNNAVQICGGVSSDSDTVAVSGKLYAGSATQISLFVVITTNATTAVRSGLGTGSGEW